MCGLGYLEICTVLPLQVYVPDEWGAKRHTSAKVHYISRQAGRQAMNSVRVG